MYQRPCASRAELADALPIPYTTIAIGKMFRRFAPALVMYAPPKCLSAANIKTVDIIDTAKAFSNSVIEIAVAR
jgi:hypothetical protein